MNEQERVGFNVITRRGFLKGGAGVMAAVAAGTLITEVAKASSTNNLAQKASTQPSSMLAYVGCYTSKERSGHGEGINVYRVDSSGNWTHLQLYKDFNPSFVTFDRKQQFLYAVHGDGDKISAFQIDKQTGQIKLLNRQPINGKNGVALAVDATNRFVVTANYATGGLASFPIKQDGSLGLLVDLVSLPGEVGPHRVQQSFSHPHDVRFDPTDHYIIVPDKGLDRIFVFRLDPANGKLIANDPPSVKSRPGAGPRHFDFHPNKPYVYVANELDSSVTTYQFNPLKGELKPTQVVPTLPTNFTGYSTCAEIGVVPSGKYLYVSNRGYDSITIFAINQSDGTLSAIGWEPTQGKTPRFFRLNPSGTMLHVANQESDTIVAFRINPEGRLIPTGQTIKTGSPSCIIFTS